MNHAQAVRGAAAGVYSAKACCISRAGCVTPHARSSGSPVVLRPREASAPASSYGIASFDHQRDRAAPRALLSRGVRVYAAADKSKAMEGKKSRADVLLAGVKSGAYQGSLSEGIIRKIFNEGVYIAREGLVEGALQLVAKKGLVIVKGPPGAGKTSLLQLLFVQASQVYDKVVFVEASGCPEDMDWDDFVYQKLEQSWADLTCPQAGSKVLILIDELHALYPRKRSQYNSLWSTINKLLSGGSNNPNAPGSNVHIIASAVYSPSPADTPFDSTPEYIG